MRKGRGHVIILLALSDNNNSELTHNSYNQIGHCRQSGSARVHCPHTQIEHISHLSVQLGSQAHDACPGVDGEVVRVGGEERVGDLPVLPQVEVDGVHLGDDAAQDGILP